MSSEETAIIIYQLAKINLAIKEFARLSLQRPQYSRFLEALGESIPSHVESFLQSSGLSSDLKKQILYFAHTDFHVDRENS